MKKIIIKTQEEFDKIKKIEVDEEVIFEADKIRINCVLEVFGILRLKGEIDSSRIENRYIVSRESSQNHIDSRGSSQNHIVSRESSQNHIVSWDSSVNTVLNTIKSIIMYSFSVVIIPFSLKIKIKKEKTAIVQKYKQEKYLKREGIKVNKGKVILFKKVGKEYKTQEQTENETDWGIGIIVEHPSWEPTKEECGGGKYHAVSKPYFGDEFRSVEGDKYVAIEIAVKDLYEWKKVQTYPHKIAFRKGKVLYECDKYGVEIK
jgi:hypothetical protein